MRKWTYRWTKRLAPLALGLGALTSGQAQAAITIYPDAGTPNPALYTFTATSSGPIIAYFAGNRGSYENILGLLVNGTDVGIYGLNSLSAVAGDSLNFGNVNAGDVLTFFIHVNPNEDGDGDPSNDRYFYSNKALNFDGVNHVYSSSYAGGDYDIPAGTYVAFEDLDYGGDFNYADLDFVFTNVSVSSAVPEPATWAMMLLGIGFVGGAMRRKQKPALQGKLA